MDSVKSGNLSGTRQDTFSVGVDANPLTLSKDSIENLRQVKFSTVTQVTATGSSLSIPTDTDMKIDILLNDQAGVDLVLKTPDAPGNFIFVVIHGSTTPSAITFSTEGTEIIHGEPNIDGVAGDHYFIGAYWNGTAWYMSASGAI